MSDSMLTAKCQSKLSDRNRHWNTATAMATETRPRHDHDDGVWHWQANSLATGKLATGNLQTIWLNTWESSWIALMQSICHSMPTTFEDLATFALML